MRVAPALFHHAAGVMLAALLMSPRAAAEAEPNAKTHTLFMGADILIQRRETLYRVTDVVGDSLVIMINGERVLVPLSRGLVAMKIEDNLKLARGEVAVTDLKTERGYSPGRDPRREFLRNAGAAAAASDEMNAAVRQYVAGQVAQNNAAALPSTNGGRAVAMADADRQMSDANRAIGSAGTAMGSDFANAGAQAQVMYNQLDRQLFDAIEISFRISSPRRLMHPYVVGIARLHEPSAKPGEFRHWIMAKALDPIGPDPQTIDIFQAGLPPGYEIDAFQLHVYNQGQELPTSVSARRVPLTRDEAFQYVLLEYVGGHKTDTLAPSVAMAQLPPALRLRVDRGELTEPLYVKVTPQGMPTGAFRDEACRDPIREAEVLEGVQSLRFKPGLDKGKPVESVARVKLSEVPL